MTWCLFSSEGFPESSYCSWIKPRALLLPEKPQGCCLAAWPSRSCGIVTFVAHYPWSLPRTLTMSGCHPSQHFTWLDPFHLCLSAKCYKLKNAFQKCISLHSTSQYITLIPFESLKRTWNLLVHLFSLLLSVPTHQWDAPQLQRS